MIIIKRICRESCYRDVIYRHNDPEIPEGKERFRISTVMFCGASCTGNIYGENFREPR